MHGATSISQQARLYIEPAPAAFIRFSARAYFFNFDDGFLEGECMRVRVGVDGFSDPNPNDQLGASGICSGFVESSRTPHTCNTRVSAPITRTKRDVLAVLTNVLNTL